MKNEGRAELYGHQIVASLPLQRRAKDFTYIILLLSEAVRSLFQFTTKAEGLFRSAWKFPWFIWRVLG